MIRAAGCGGAGFLPFPAPPPVSRLPRFPRRIASEIERRKVVEGRLPPSDRLV